ncbi:MAG: SurA N-terminal domain-containing protein [Chitinophagaceae bacterium]|nr:SurA N-terminal domain-containing protein [Oligoflexus sp.]
MFKWNKTSDIDTKAIGKHWITYGILGTVIITMAFFGVCSPRNGSGGFTLPSGTAAKVDGEKIGSVEFRRAYLNYSNQLQQQYKDKFDPVALGVSKQVLNGLVERTALYKEATKNGIAASEGEVDHVILDGKYFAGENGKFDPALFERYLKSQGHTEATFTEELRRNIITTKFRNFVASSYRASDKVAELNYRLDESKVDIDYLRLDPSAFPVKVEPAEVDKFLTAETKQIKDYYDAHKAEYNQEAKVKARHILIAFKGARNASGAAANRSKDEAKALAAKVLAEAKKPGADFPALAGKYTDEASGKAKGGDVGFFKKDTMVKEFADAAFAMKPGQISDLVESPFGFHIIRVDTVQEAKAVTFDEAKHGIAEKLVTKQRQPQIVNDKIKAILTDLKAGKDDAASLGLAWKSTGPFSVGARFIPGLGADKAALQTIATLKTPGQVSPDAIEISNVKYIVRLKAKQDADMSKLTPEKRKELAESSKYMESYTLFNTISEDISKRYEKEGKIYKNPDFVAYDQKLHGKGNAESEDSE